MRSRKYPPPLVVQSPAPQPTPNSPPSPLPDTGDRPYRCQYCGDQFARSDLLSRHINKCHATEKASTHGSAGRRKGQGLDATTRATTSKQACDDCVIQNLPCDGGNPCGKCMQRKARCTYIKFQRQTAPRGPGHRTTHSEDATAATASYGRLNDLYATSAALHAQPLSAGPVYTTNPGIPSAASFSFQPESMYRYPRAPSDSPQPDDFTARYRAQAELLQRAGNMYNSAAAATGVYPNGSPILPSGNYADNTVPHDRAGASANGVSWTTSLNGSNAAAATAAGIPYHGYDTTSASLGGLSQSVPTSGYAGPAVGTSADMGRYSMPSYSHIPPTNGLAYSMDARDIRRRSLDYHSDSGSTASYSSVPSSASSSSLHLPVADMSSQRLDGRGHPQAMSLSQPSHHFPNLQGQVGPPSNYQYPAFNTTATAQDLSSAGVQPVVSAPVGEGGFSSAFGLLSLEDQNVLAGISSDGTPFFSTAAMNLLVAEEEAANAQNTNVGVPAVPDTPVDAPAAREHELKELREFWKQYMRTPLTGSTPRAEGGYILGNPINTGGTPSQVGGGRPAHPKRGLSRVVSLPNVKTPIAEHPVPGISATAAQMRERNRTMHDGEDLRSYEQAVLARKAPQLTFNPPVRRPRHSASPKVGTGGVDAGDGSSGSGSGGGHSPAGSSSMGGSPAMAPSMPPPSTNTSGMGGAGHSSLSQAFSASASISGSMSHHSAYPPNVGPIASTAPSERMKHNPSVMDPSSGGARSAISGTDAEDTRPAFKRLPSTQIGPMQPKRTLLNDTSGVEDGSGLSSHSVNGATQSMVNMMQLSARI